MPTTATVEVLTAEVRVLMVGSRQITKSVWAQLDWVEPDLVEAMGRVEPETTPDAISVIGRHVENGSLVRTTIQPPERRKDYGSRDCWTHNRRSLTPHQARLLMGKFDAATLLPLIVLAGLR